MAVTLKNSWFDSGVWHRGDHTDRLTRKVAQLVERLVDNEKVAGSNPVLANKPAFHLGCPNYSISAHRTTSQANVGSIPTFPISRGSGQMVKPQEINSFEKAQ